MSDTEKPAAAAGAAAAAAGKGWSDKERLVYLYALVEQTGQKPDFKNTPRPVGRTEIACQRMVDRLKTTLKDELAALKGGTYVAVEGAVAAATAGAPTTPKKPTPKRKTPAKDKNAAVDADEQDGSPKKRGRKKKGDVEAAKVVVKEDVKGGDGEDEQVVVKYEVDAEDLVDVAEDYSM